jgi:hypothetical protein
MTTLLPSGEIFTASKLTKLKNSSRVSLGLADWDWAMSDVQITNKSETDRRIGVWAMLSKFRQFERGRGSADCGETAGPSLRSG